MRGGGAVGGYGAILVAPDDAAISVPEAMPQMFRARFARGGKLDDRIPFYDWAMKVPEPKAGKLDFKRFPFQLELYKAGADDREMVIMKSTQVGVSAYGVRWAMYHADITGMTGLYIFPTQSDVYDFSDARIKPAIDGSEYLSSRVRSDDPQNKGLKKIGLGFVYFRGSESKRKLDSVDADHIVFDEYDTLQQDNIPDAERRLSGSLLGLLRRVGVPSVPEYGIHKAYGLSDQRQWHTKCGCGEWQTVTFAENVDMVRAIRICRKCTKPLDVGKGEWVATYPDREVRGYHITRLIAPSANLATIIAASKKKAPYERQVFHNKDLGEAFAPAEGRLSREVIQAAQNAAGGFTQTTGYRGPHLITMGVDVASTRALNVRVSEHFSDTKKRGLLISEVDTFDDLADLMDRFEVKMCCIDHLPEGRLARSFAERFAGRVYLVSYDVTPNPRDTEVIKVDEEMRHVRVRRTEALDATFSLLRSQDNHLPLDLPEDYADSMGAPVRYATVDPLGKAVVGYRSTGPDDYAHAEAYDLVATEVYFMRQGLNELTRDELKPLDEMLEFQRSDLGNYGAEPGDYYEGGRDGGYHAGGRE